ncbi:MAG TPA: transketolase, partial [Thermoanaerobaculia bacterium]|nr:transketolase [Thermoanaerobaculia bacterium]
MRTAFLDTLYELAKADRRIVFVTGDLGFSVVERFMTELPDQFVNAGVAEQNMTSLAAGMALMG